MKRWRVREDYLPLLKRTKKLFPTLLAHVNTKRIFLCSSTAKKASYAARIHANRPPFVLLTDDVDYAIESWENHFDSLSPAWQVYVMLHEMMHIPREGFDPKSKVYRRLLKHDLEDFHILRSIYGLHNENVAEVLKGEEFFYKLAPKRFPRLAKIK